MRRDKPSHIQIARVVVVAAIVALAGACGGDEPDAEAVLEGVQDSVDAALEEAGVTMPDGSMPDVSMPDVSMPDVSMPDATIPVASDANPDIKALASLTTEEVCAFTPKAEVEAIVGAAVEDGFGMPIPDLGTSCSFYSTEDGLTSLAKTEFSVFTWAATKMLIEETGGGGEACEVDGREAICETVAAEYSDPGVYVKLGGDNDLALYASSVRGIDAAKQIAILALSNLNL